MRAYTQQDGEPISKRPMMVIGPLNTNEIDIIKFIVRFHSFSFEPSLSLSLQHMVDNSQRARSLFQQIFQFQIGRKMNRNQNPITKRP